MKSYTDTEVERMLEAREWDVRIEGRLIGLEKKVDRHLDEHDTADEERRSLRMGVGFALLAAGLALVVGVL